MATVDLGSLALWRSLLYYELRDEPVASHIAPTPPAGSKARPGPHFCIKGHCEAGRGGLLLHQIIKKLEELLLH